MLPELIGEGLDLVGVTQRLAPGVGERFELLPDLLLLLGQLAGILPHLSHLFGELAGALLPQILGHLLEVLLSAGSLGQRLLSRLAVERFRGALHFAASLFELFARVGHGRLVFTALHSLPQLISIREQRLLLFAQALEPALKLLAFLIGLRRLQGSLQFLDALVEVLLALGQLLEAVEHLELLALLLIHRRLRLTLRFVAVFGLLEIELIKLALHLRVPGLLSALIAAARNQVLAGGELE